MGWGSRIGGSGAQSSAGHSYNAPASAPGTLSTRPVQRARALALCGAALRRTSLRPPLACAPARPLARCAGFGIRCGLVSVSEARRCRRPRARSGAKRGGARVCGGAVRASFGATHRDARAAAQWMFNELTAFNADIGLWDVSKVTDMSVRRRSG